MRLIDADNFEDFIRKNCADSLVDLWCELVRRQPTIKVDPMHNGKWMLEEHNQRTNYRWNVTAKCSQCNHELGEIWAGFFPGLSEELEEFARMSVIECAKNVKLSNFCPECGADMREGSNSF